LTGVIVAAMFIYFGVLHVLDGRAESYFQTLRQSDPDLYLTQLREASGFATYLASYTEMEGFGSYKSTTPTFLVGRWTLRHARLRLTPGTAPSECTAPVTFEHGLMLVHDNISAPIKVSYRIEGDTVQVKSADGTVLPVKIVSYGADLDHVEFVPPGQTAGVYAYTCGR